MTLASKFSNVLEAMSNQDMVSGHHAVKAQLVALFCYPSQGLGPGVGTVIGQVKSELHAAPLVLSISSKVVG